MHDSETLTLHDTVTGGQLQGRRLHHELARYAHWTDQEKQRRTIPPVSLVVQRLERFA